MEYSGREQLTRPIILIIELPIQQRRQLLEILPRIVQQLLQSAHLLMLIGAPLALIRELQDPQPIGGQIGDGGEQRADRIGMLLLLVGIAAAAAHGGRQRSGVDLDPALVCRSGEDDAEVFAILCLIEANIQRMRQESHRLVSYVWPGGQLRASRIAE
jgi:hypothetical protein